MQLRTLRAIGSLHSGNLAFLHVLAHVEGIPENLVTGVLDMRSQCGMIAATILLTATTQAQSLGEIARQQQHKKVQQTAPVSDKVLTNDDLSIPRSGSDSKPASPKPVHSPEPVEQKSKTASADELRNKIDKQKQRIALLQDAIDKLQGSIQYVQNNRNIYVNAPEYNEEQKRRQQEVDQLRGRLESAKSDLSDLQEQARQAGYGSAVYQ
jgi:DNA repair exonuclease SbcCD ATPase subunit